MNPELTNVATVVSQLALGGGGGGLLCTGITDGFPCRLDIYVGMWDSDTSLYVCTASTLLAELSPQPLNGCFDPACICIGHALAVSSLNAKVLVVFTSTVPEDSVEALFWCVFLLYCILLLFFYKLE